MVDKVEVVAEETTAEKPVVEETQQTEQANETQSTQSKPEGLPEKFNSVEELAKSYSELEKKLGEQSQQRPSPANPNPDNKSTLEVAENAVKDAGLNMETLQKEYSEKGELDTKSYEA